MAHTTWSTPHLKLAFGDASPGIAYHRWHQYDDHKFEDTKDTRHLFLGEIAARIDAVGRLDEYRDWHERHRTALEGLGADLSFEATTLWRLVAGTATNPALESGLHLHPLWGVPVIPGSSVKGLLHHYAEQEVVAEAEALPSADGVELSACKEPPAAVVEKLLEGARRVRQIFGGLVVERGTWKPDGETEELVGPETPRSLLEGWRRAKLLPEDIDSKHVDAVLAPFTSGRLAVYDALPAPGQKLGEVDILNPHYPDYYNDQGETPPSDDQSPKPVFFLAVCAGVRFTFPWRLTEWESKEKKVLPDDGIRKLVARWLADALADWGVGGKTAAGYGYFTTGEQAIGEQPDLEPPAPEAPTYPYSEVWETVNLSWDRSRRELIATTADRRKAPGDEAMFERLPDSTRNRLLKKKSVKINVQVRFESKEWLVIEGFPDLTES